MRISRLNRTKISKELAKGFQNRILKGTQKLHYIIGELLGKTSEKKEMQIYEVNNYLLNKQDTV